MRKNKRSNKAGLVLVSLVLIGYLFINLGQKITFGNESVQAPVVESLPEPQQDSTNGSQGVEEEIIQGEPQAMIALIGEEYTVDVTKEVKGLGDVWDFIINFPTCANYQPAQGLDSVNKLCGSDGTTVNMDERSVGQGFLDIFRGNTQVDVNAVTNIELTTVTYPLAFFLGQFVIENSNREASLESPNYPSNGQIIDKNYTLKTHSPAETEEYSEFFEETVRKDYEVSASVDAGGVDGTLTTDDTEEGKYGVMNVDDAKCECEEPEVSNSDYKPGSPNRQGSVGGGWLRQQAPGGDNYDPPSIDDACLALDKNYKMMAVGNVAACFNVPRTIAGKISGLFSKAFSRGDWEDCNDGKEECVDDGQGGEICTMIPPSTHCTGSMQLGVKMTPIFGEPYKCEDELCANAYLTNSYKAGLGPSEADAKVVEGGGTEGSLMFFVGTPCIANVSTGNSMRSVRVTCLWDVSPYLLDYNLQKTFEAPNDEEFPSTFNIYWDLVMQAMELSADYYGLE